MNSPDERPATERAVSAPSSRWPEAIAVALPTVALLVSGYSLFDAQRQHRAERATELLDQIHEDWDEMSAGE